jgi:hypothetical protein
MNAHRLMFGFLTLVLLAEPVRAATLKWSGTLSVDFPFAAPFTGEGRGVATVNGSSGLGHLNTLTLAGGLTAGGTAPNTDPEAFTALVSIRGTATLGPGTFAPISGGGPLTLANTARVEGTFKLCLLFVGCSVTFPIRLDTTTLSGARLGVGLGGIVTTNTFAPPTLARASVTGAPWTVGVASVTSVETPNGTGTVTAQGFAHGPLSISTTANPSGVLQFVTPARITFSGNNEVIFKRPLITTLRLHFVPEPGTLLLLGCCIAVLLMVGRGRIRP